MGATSRHAHTLLSVVLPTLGRSSLGAQLDALGRCQWDHPWEVVVADNSLAGSARPAVARWVRQDVPIRWVDASQRTGRSSAVNAGARAAEGLWLVTCDDDDIVAPEFVAAVGRAFLAGAESVAFNLNVRAINPPATWMSVDHAQMQDRRPMYRGLPALWGCSGIGRAVFLGLGGYDEELPYAEDLDFTLRYHEAGLSEPAWVEQALIHYRLPATWRSNFRKGRGRADAAQRLTRKHPASGYPPLRRPASEAVVVVRTMLRGVRCCGSPSRRLRNAGDLGYSWQRLRQSLAAHSRWGGRRT